MLTDRNGHVGFDRAGGIDLNIDAAEHSEKLTAALDDVHRYVRNGRRDRADLKRILHNYGIPNDAGIGDTIAAATLYEVTRITNRIFPA